MEVILKFDSSEEREAREALSGSRARSVIWELDNEMRTVVKHGEQSEEVKTEVERIRKMLHDLCDDYGINLDE